MMRAPEYFYDRITAQNWAKTRFSQTLSESNAL